MTQGEWEDRIKKSAREIGTYTPSFDAHIETLAGLLAIKDLVKASFIDEGSPITAEYTNKAGKTNVVVNPTLDLIIKIDRVTLPYFRDLGLTPYGIVKVNKEGPGKPRSASLSQILADIGRNEITPEGEFEKGED